MVNFMRSNPRREKIDESILCIKLCYIMKTATVRDLRNHYTSLLRWIAAGEEVVITQKGVPVARLGPPPTEESSRVNWVDSPEVKRNRQLERQLTAQESAALIAEAGGRW